MATEVDIANLALAHLGDVANVQAIDPPDGSAQAEHCQRFYPIARDSLLEMHEWGFATGRAALPALVPLPGAWLYRFAVPNDALRVLAVLDPLAADDVSVGYSAHGDCQSAGYTPQPFVVERNPADGTRTVLTNLPSATARLTYRVTDTARFSPLFVETLSWSLAAMVAGPLLKGEVGMKAAMAATQMFERKLSSAKTSDAGQQRTTFLQRQSVPWLSAR